MPYIDSTNNRREKLRNGEPSLLAGELNYQIFYHIKHGIYTRSIINGFVEQFLGEKPNYQRYNDMTGALIRCYVEVLRRLQIDADVLLKILESYNDEIANYEDEKIKSNGDVE